VCLYPSLCSLTLLAPVDTLKRAWEISWDDITIVKQIGKGAFGVVYSGLWRDYRVAVKIVGPSEFFTEDLGSLSSEVDKEVTMLQTVRHPNIVLFFGAGKRTDGATFLVTELIELGTLSQVLAQGSSIPWSQKILFALDTARGMAHVHSIHRMHRDLKSSNLLVSGSMHVKVADFGTATLASLAKDGRDHHNGEQGASTVGSTSRPISDVSAQSKDSVFAGISRSSVLPHASPPQSSSPVKSHTFAKDGEENPAFRTIDSCLDNLSATQAGQHTRGVGSPLWMAPEVMQGLSYGFSADVFSFGVVMWEIAAQAMPWSSVNGSALTLLLDLLPMLLSGQRPPVDPAWPEKYVQLMCASWATASSERPTFEHLVSMLVSLDTGGS
jgi:serine/threonine protein kinase